MFFKCYNVNEKMFVDAKIKIQKYKLQNGIEIDAVLVGEKGIGRKLGILPVQVDGLWNPVYEVIKEYWKTEDKEYEYLKLKNQWYIYKCSIGKTKAGFPKLIETREKNIHVNGIILQIEPPLYHRGGGSYTWSPQEPEILVSGTIAQGGAGRMGSINHYIYKITTPCECLIKLSGDPYGEPSEFKIKITQNWEVSCLSLEEEKLL